MDVILFEGELLGLMVGQQLERLGTQEVHPELSEGKYNCESFSTTCLVTFLCLIHRSAFDLDGLDPYIFLFMGQPMDFDDASVSVRKGWLKSGCASTGGGIRDLFRHLNSFWCSSIHKKFPLTEISAWGDEITSKPRVNMQ